MRIRLVHLLLVWSFLMTLTAKAQTSAVPDTALLHYLQASYPAVLNTSNELIHTQAATVTGTFNLSGKKITSLEGVQYFTGISTLNARNNLLTQLPDISNLQTLKTLDVQSNALTSLPDLSALTNLQKIFAANNQLTELPDLTNNTNLTQLIVFRNNIDSLPTLNHLTKLEKIDIGNNPITQLPDISALSKLEELLIWNTRIDSLPPMNSYPNLWRLNIGGNNLTTLPDLSQNVKLKQLYLDRNQFTSLPDLTALDSLEDVRLQNNLFDFLALSPILSYPGKDTIFQLSPQNDFPSSPVTTIENDTLQLPAGISGFPVTTYQWYFNNKLSYTTNLPVLKLFPATKKYSGSYYVMATSTAFPGLTLKTTAFNATVTNCFDVSKLSFEKKDIKCLSSGELWITTTSLPTGNYTYSLKSPSTNFLQQTNNGHFIGLFEPFYSLTISNDTCTVHFQPPIVLEVEACKETFITPNGDSDKDSYYFTQTGKAVIYDKQGKKIKTLQLPAEWDGTTSNGSLAPQGYYSANINDGEEYVNITVVY